MKTKLAATILFVFLLSCLTTTAQDYLLKDSLTVINIGEGRMQYSLKSTGELLEGFHKIIDRKTSEYVTAHFTEGLFDGKYSRYRTLDKLIEDGQYRMGRKHGISKEYYSDGKSAKIARTYDNGSLTGLTTTYYTNGKREYEREYVDGKKDGYEKKWAHPDGTLLNHMHYTRDTLNGSYIQYINNNVSDFVITCDYRMGVLHGKYVETYTDGNIRRQGSYKNGQRTGKWTGTTRLLDDKGKISTKKFKENYP